MGRTLLDNLSGFLNIEMSEPSVCIGNLLNERAPSGAKVIDVHMDWDVCENHEFREPRPEELAETAFPEPTISLRGYGTNVVVEHKARNGSSFSVEDLMNAIVATERKSREQSMWFGGPDVHHVYFEGLHEVNGVWEICFGS